jgi:hypothetical protein
MNFFLNMRKMRKAKTLSGFTLLLLFVFSSAASAATQTLPKVYGGYNKSGSSFDVVVKYEPNKKLQLYVNDKKSVEATVQRDSWATFHKVTLTGTGTVSFSESSKKLSSKSYFEVKGTTVKFYESTLALAQAHTNSVSTRTKTSNCQITQNREQDPACTPGAMFSNVTKEIVCRSGYSKSVRNVTSNTKKKVFSEYGISSHPSGAYEVDHLISLELGGTNDIANLWPEAAAPTPGFHEKDKVENYLHSQVCSGKMSLPEAQQKIATGWLQVYLGLFPAPAPKVTAAPAPNPVATTSPSPAPTQPAANGVVKMSSSKICHAPGTTYYDRTTNFTPYDDMDSCLQAGGRLPLR